MEKKLSQNIRKKKRIYLVLTVIISIVFFAIAMNSIHICHNIWKNANYKVRLGVESYTGTVVDKKIESKKFGPDYYIKYTVESNGATKWEKVSKIYYNQVSVGNSVNFCGYNGYYALNTENVIDIMISKYSNIRNIIIWISLFVITICITPICFFLMSGTCIKISKSYLTTSYYEIIYWYIFLLIELVLVLISLEYEEDIFLIVAIEIGIMFLLIAGVIHFAFRTTQCKVKDRAIYVKKGLFGVDRITFDELNEARKVMLPFMYQGSVYIKIPGDYIQLNLENLIGGYDFVQKLFKELQWDNTVKIEEPPFYRYKVWSRSKSQRTTSVNDPMYESICKILENERKKNKK